MPAAISAIETRDERGRGLRVEFLRERDRYGHRVSVVSDGREATLLVSQEGSDEDHWPPSPPLQQLSIEEREAGRHVALLLGMAGKSHWSLSVEPGSQPLSFVFDVACRLRDNPGYLGSTYQFHGHADPSSDGCLIASSSARLWLGPVAFDHNASTISRDPQRQLLLVEPQRMLRSALLVRWRYEVRWIWRSD